MKRLFSKLKNEIKEFQMHNYYLSLFSEISILLKNNLSSSEIELFINRKLSEFDENFFTEYFNKYATLLNQMNSLQLINYIHFLETLKKDLILTLIKKLLYPIGLIIMSFCSLSIFKHSLLSLISDFDSSHFTILITIIYYISLVTIISLLLLFIIIAFLFKNPVTLIFGYNRIKRIKLFMLIENYYLSIFMHLLISFYEEGYSTLEIFKLINTFKSDPIISNIAYFLNSDLEDGLGLEVSINNMHCNDTFKNILVFSITTQNFIVIIKNYAHKLNRDMYVQINNLVSKLYLIAYIYLAFIIVLLYKILSLPLSMLNQI